MEKLVDRFVALGTAHVQWGELQGEDKDSKTTEIRIPKGDEGWSTFNEGSMKEFRKLAKGKIEFVETQGGPVAQRKWSKETRGPVQWEPKDAYTTLRKATMHAARKAECVVRVVERPVVKKEMRTVGKAKRDDKETDTTTEVITAEQEISAQLKEQEIRQSENLLIQAVAEVRNPLDEFLKRQKRQQNGQNIDGGEAERIVLVDPEKHPEGTRDAQEITRAVSEFLAQRYVRIKQFLSISVPSGLRSSIIGVAKAVGMGTLDKQEPARDNAYEKGQGKSTSKGRKGAGSQKSGWGSHAKGKAPADALLGQVLDFLVASRGILSVGAQELVWAFSTQKNTSVKGAGGIPIGMSAMASRSVIEALGAVANAIVLATATSPLPSDAVTLVLRPVMKPLKDRQQPHPLGYAAIKRLRAVNALSMITSTIDMALAMEYKWLIGRRYASSCSHFGAAGRGIAMLIGREISFILNQRQRGLKVAEAITDAAKAYDTVRIRMLIARLIVQKAPNRLIRTLLKLLTERFTELTMAGATTDRQKIKGVGQPQGGRTSVEGWSDLIAHYDPSHWIGIDGATTEQYNIPYLAEEVSDAYEDMHMALARGGQEHFKKAGRTSSILEEGEDKIEQLDADRAKAMRLPEAKVQPQWQNCTPDKSGTSLLPPTSSTACCNVDPAVAMIDRCEVVISGRVDNISTFATFRDSWHLRRIAESVAKAAERYAHIHEVSFTSAAQPQTESESTIVAYDQRTEQKGDIFLHGEKLQFLARGDSVKDLGQYWNRALTADATYKQLHKRVALSALEARNRQMHHAARGGLRAMTMLLAVVEGLFLHRHTILTRLSTPLELRMLDAKINKYLGWFLSSDSTAQFTSRSHAKAVQEAEAIRRPPMQDRTVYIAQAEQEKAKAERKEKDRQCSLEIERLWEGHRIQYEDGLQNVNSDHQLEDFAEEMLEEREVSPSRQVDRGEETRGRHGEQGKMIGAWTTLEDKEEALQGLLGNVSKQEQDGSLKLRHEFLTQAELGEGRYIASQGIEKVMERDHQNLAQLEALPSFWDLVGMMRSTRRLKALTITEAIKARLQGCNFHDSQMQKVAGGILTQVGVSRRHQRKFPAGVFHEAPHVKLIPAHYTMKDALKEAGFTERWASVRIGQDTKQAAQEEHEMRNLLAATVQEEVERRPIRVFVDASTSMGNGTSAWDAKSTIGIVIQYRGGDGKIKQEEIAVRLAFPGSSSKNEVSALAIGLYVAFKIARGEALFKRSNIFPAMIMEKETQHQEFDGAIQRASRAYFAREESQIAIVNDCEQAATTLLGNKHRTNCMETTARQLLMAINTNGATIRRFYFPTRADEAIKVNGEWVPNSLHRADQIAKVHTWSQVGTPPPALDTWPDFHRLQETIRILALLNLDRRNANIHNRKPPVDLNTPFITKGLAGYEKWDVTQWAELGADRKKGTRYRILQVNPTASRKRLTLFFRKAVETRADTFQRQECHAVGRRLWYRVDKFCHRATECISTDAWREKTKSRYKTFPKNPAAQRNFFKKAITTACPKIVYHTASDGVMERPTWESSIKRAITEVAAAYKIATAAIEEWEQPPNAKKRRANPTSNCALSRFLDELGLESTLQGREEQRREDKKLLLSRIFGAEEPEHGESGRDDMLTDALHRATWAEGAINNLQYGDLDESEEE